MTGPAGSMPTYLGMPAFPVAARTAVADSQLRANLAHATHTIRAKRAGAVAELADWEELRQAAKAIKDHTLAHLDTYLLRLEANVTRAGGHGKRFVPAQVTDPARGVRHPQEGHGALS